MSQFLTPAFHPSFVGVLRILAQQDTEVKQKRAFKRFVRDYGTHYLSSAYLGKFINFLNYNFYQDFLHKKVKLTHNIHENYDLLTIFQVECVHALRFRDFFVK